MERVPVSLRENGNGLDAEFFAAQDDPESNFSAVGDEYLSKHIFH